jgi:alpha-glucosidase
MGFLAFRYNSPTDEEIYGLGLQYTVWNFKGKTVPIISSEGGVGRGLRPITAIANRFNQGQGGNPTTSYTASYTHITNKNRAFLFNTTAMGFLDF